MQRCGADIDQAIEFCLAHSDSVPAGVEGETPREQIPREGGSSFAAFLSSWLFSSQAGAAELQELQDEQAETERILKSLARAGLQELRFQERKAKRRSSTCSRALQSSSPPEDSHDQYLQRSRQEWPGTLFSVIDAGMLAGTTTNACFWLSLVAAWSRLPQIQ